MVLASLISALALLTAQDAAEQSATLDQLYAQLSATQTPGQAASIAGQIEIVWTDSGSDTANLLLDRADQALAEGDTDRAQRHLDDALILQPDYAEAWNRRAELYMSQSEPAAALDAVNRALIADAKHYRALVNLGLILERLERGRAAFEAYEEALKVHPYHEQARARRDRLAPLIEGRAL